MAIIHIINIMEEKTDSKTLLAFPSNQFYFFQLEDVKPFRNWDILGFLKYFRGFANSYSYVKNVTFDHLCFQSAPRTETCY
jgi:hypothetical protein